MIFTHYKSLKIWRLI